MMGFAGKTKVNWDMITYWLGFGIGMVILIVWIIAKLLGIIHSPVWVEMLPLIGIGMTIGTIGVKTGRKLEKLDLVYAKVLQHDKQLEQIRESLLRIEHKMDAGFAELRVFRREYDAHLKRHHA